MAGLEAFEKADITAPRVIENGEINGDAYLLLSYLEEGGKGSQKELGQLVAKMHSHQQSEGKFDSSYLMKVLMSHLIIHGQSLGVKFL